MTERGSGQQHPVGFKEGMKEQETSEVEEREESETLPLRQRAERNERGRQSRTLLSHRRTKRRGASWEPEPCAATDAILDKHTMAHMHKSKRKHISQHVIIKDVISIDLCFESFW